MRKIKTENIEAILKLVNDKCTHKTNRLIYQNNSLYLVDKDIYKKNYTVLQHITTGTKKEIYEHLHAMKNVFWYLLK